MDYKIILIIVLIIAVVFLVYIYKKNREPVLIQNTNDYVKLKQEKNNKLGVELKKKPRNIDMPLFSIDFDRKKINPYLEIFIGDEYAGKVVFELFDDIVPKTCMNFRYMCSRNFKKGGAPIYQTKNINRIEKDTCIYFGKDVKYSIYGKYFEDENFELKHNQPGIISMNNYGKDKNNSEIMIHLKKRPDLDGKHVVFGIIKDGYEVLEKLCEIELDNTGKPYKRCKIVKCGLME